ncbi:hypothetical protein BZL30_0568 [Mycobacterium kansasii]|uniref:Uncharacterized protein n=1 Tax=Mycobacterium kansasii TaxID=1768 RepID=A0A1V3XSQ9_MYCKA|nr:hypothetical protein BZL30_0568 [Mycobacterium kansasii]
MVTTAIAGIPLLSVVRPASGEAGPWRLLRCRTLLRDRPARGANS